MLLCAVTVLLAASERPANTDVFLESQLTRSVRDNTSLEAAALRKTVFISSVEPRWGVPTMLWATRPAPGTRSYRDLGLTPEQAARRHLYALAPLYRFQPSELTEVQLLDTQSLLSGAVLVSFTRVSAGLPVYRHRVTVVMNHELELAGISGALPPTRGAPRFRLTPETAIATAVQELTGEFPPAGALKRIALGMSGWASHDVAGGVLSEPPRVRRVLYSTDSRLIAAYQVELVVPRPHDERWAYTMLISAEDGRRLTRLDARSDASSTYRVWAQSATPFTPLDGPQGHALAPYPQAAPTPYPAMTFLAPLLVTVDHSASSTQDPWLPAGSPTLTGNNAVAYLDVNAPDGFNGPDAGAADLRPTASAGSTWDYTYDLSLGPTAQPAQTSGSAVQAFFIANFMHDTMYDHGFTEAARNGQHDNLGRGGIAGDELQVEVDDYATRNDAHTTTFADGKASKLELGIFDFNARSTLTVNTPDAGVYPATPVVEHNRAFNLTADAVFVQTLDGGSSICGPYVNTAALVGKIAIGQAGPCAQDTILALAADAGAAGVILTTTVAPYAAIDFADATAVPMQIVDPVATQPLLDAADAGLPINLTMQRDVSPDLPSALDSSIVMHEWTHFLSSRLVGDANGLLPTQSLGLSEGWSDFVALVLLSQAADAQAPQNANWTGSFGYGSFATSGTEFDGTPRSSAYYGLRRYPYSADLTKNPLTFKHSGTNVPLPTGVAMSPRPANVDNAEPHNAGEVWASALWQVYTAFLNDPRYTFDQARTRVLNYLVASLKTTPVLPTFIEARDAMLLLMHASDGQDFALAQRAFAVRGLGLGAQSADRYSSTNTPLKEDFATTGGAYELVDAALTDDRDACDSDGFLDNNEKGTLTIRLMNVGAVRMTATTLTLRSSNPALAFDTSPLPVPPSDPFTITTLTVPIDAGLIASAAEATTTFTMTLTDAALPTTTLPFSQDMRLNADKVQSTTEGFEVGASLWAIGMNGDFPYEDTWRIHDVSAANHSIRSKDPGSPGDTTLTSPALHVGAGAFSFTFVHTYAFEASGTAFYDGGLLELSTDGVTFTQIPGSAISPTYTGVLSVSNTNPLSGRTGFVGQQQSAITETVTLGTQYANQTVWIRFRVGADINGESQGWTVDDVAFTGLTDLPFVDVIAHRSNCTNHPPTLTPAASQTVDERTHVVLVPGQAMDRDMDPLTLTWTQTFGPMVTLTGNEFDAPEVTSKTDLGFTLTASDGRGGTATDTITVTVRNVNRAPTADTGQPQVVESGAVVTLDGSASSDPDGDHLLFTWRLTNGPQVQLTGASTATATFTAPVVKVETDFTFELVVDDGEDKSPSAISSVTVKPKTGGCGCGCSAGDPSWAVGLLALAAWSRRRRTTGASS